MQTVSCITVLENFLGDSVDTENVGQLLGLSPDQRADLFDVLEMFYQSYEAPPKDANTIRLLLHGTGPGRYALLFPPWAGEGGNLEAEIKDLVQNVGVFLLYAHMVVIPDPLTRLFTRRSEHRELRLNSFKGDRAFRKFVSLLTMILSLKELIEAGVVTLFPEVLYNEDNSHVSEALSRRDMQDAQIMELTNKMMTYWGEDAAIRGIPMPILGLNNVLLQSQFTESSLIASDGTFFDLIRRKQDILSADVRASCGLEAVNVHSLRNITVPVFDILNPQDLISIRQNEDLFHGWRRDLSALLSALETSPFEEITNATEIRRKADEMMYAKYSDLNKRLSAESYLTSLKSGMAKFGLGTLVSYALTGSVAVALAAAGAAEITNVTYDLLRRRARQGQRALVSHYAVLLDESGRI